MELYSDEGIQDPQPVPPASTTISPRVRVSPTEGIPGDLPGAEPGRNLFAPSITSTIPPRVRVSPTEEDPGDLPGVEPGGDATIPGPLVSPGPAVPLQGALVQQDHPHLPEQPRLSGGAAAFPGHLRPKVGPGSLPPPPDIPRPVFPPRAPRSRFVPPQPEPPTSFALPLSLGLRQPQSAPPLSFEEPPRALPATSTQSLRPSNPADHNVMRRSTGVRREYRPP